jgi:AcrR family transcriptional regulator
MRIVAAATRGDATRDALIRAAVDIFGHDGFDATGTRAIAEAAGVNQAMIAYHFGGKAGLYRSALEFIVEQVRQTIGPLLDGIDAELADERVEVSPARCLELLLQMLDAFVVIVTSEQSGPWARLILKEQQDPSEGFDILYDGFMNQALGLIARLAARARRMEPDSDAANLLAFSLVGQVLIYRTGRAAVERRTGWRRFTDAEVAAIRSRIHENVTAILSQETPE